MTTKLSHLKRESLSLSMKGEKECSSNVEITAPQMQK